MIIFLGIAGSGKSTQCRLLAESLDCKYISVGQLLRKGANSADQEKLVNGNLLNNSVVIGVVEAEIANIAKSNEFIIDGFPRTIEQAKWITGIMSSDLVRVVHIKADATEIIKRLRLRNRQDDNTDAINKRIGEYNISIGPIIEEFKSKHIDVYDIDGFNTIEDVHEQIVAYINGTRS
ncbi:MAG TPA: nucleoside monophosphate kinase [Candidatus Saccharimonadales bacterium]